ncbi:hypothetical protein GCM10009127_01740 [Alteraurantiacibacter aestuarii]
MVYTRKLQRQMVGGAMLEVTRNFNVHFEPFGAGYRLEGTQLSASVAAPSRIAEFARLEEQRVETGVFPLLLDRMGQIVDGAGPHESHEIEEALAGLNREYERNGPDGQELDLLVEALHQAGARMTSQLPRDIFAPVETTREQQQEIALPWGESGAVTTRFVAVCDPQTGLMHEASREVVTDLAGDQRRTVESWRLIAA